MHFMMVYLLHHNFMSVKVSILCVHSNIENCSELPSVMTFCTIANYTLVGKCVLLIVILLQFLMSKCHIGPSAAKSVLV